MSAGGGDDSDESFDEIARDLQTLRADAGHLSYAEIAARIADRRQAQGAAASAARLARSTVYDVFRPGRTRISASLVGEIAAVLGADDAEVAEWIARCRRARARAERPAPAPSAESARPAASAPALSADTARPVPADIAQPVPAASPRSAPSTVPARSSSTEQPATSHRVTGEGPALTVALTSDAATLPAPAPAVPRPTLDVRRPLPRTPYVLAVLAASATLNLLVQVVEPWLNLPLYLDMIGTAVAAIALGPWYGVGVAVVTNLGSSALNNPDALPFVLVNIVGALVWGYGSRLGLGRTVPRFFVLNLLTAVACTLVAVPLLLLIFDGTAGHSADQLTGRILQLSGAMVWAVFASNLMVSVADKLVAGFIALAVLDAVRKRWHVPIGFELPTLAASPPLR